MNGRSPGPDVRGTVKSGGDMPSPDVELGQGDLLGGSGFDGRWGCTHGRGLSETLGGPERSLLAFPHPGVQGLSDGAMWEGVHCLETPELTSCQHQKKRGRSVPASLAGIWEPLGSLAGFETGQGISRAG